MSEYINRNELLKNINENVAEAHNERCSQLLEAILNAPTADVVEVRHNFNVGDFCLYGFADGNKSLAIVEIVKILDDERGIAELKFHKVIKDNTGNGYFHYLFKSGHTMNGSFEYLKNITPKMKHNELKPYLKVITAKHIYEVCAIYEPHPFRNCAIKESIEQCGKVYDGHTGIDDNDWCWVYYDCCGNPIGISYEFPEGEVVEKFTAENIGHQSLADYLNKENEEFIKAWNRRANDG